MSGSQLSSLQFSSSQSFSLSSCSNHGLAPTGLGLRREHVTDLLALTDSEVAKLGFVEFAPENWLPFGGILQQRMDAIADRFPLVCHGLSLNIGGVDPINEQFLRDLKQFFDRYPVQIYSEHLSYTAAGGQLYDLLPLPFRHDAVTHLVSRIQQVQDALQRPLVLENISFYSPVAPEMTELEFLLEVLKQSGCGLLLDVNNVYVNSINHCYDAKAFIDALPSTAIRYGHVAGHYQQAPDLLIDTHGSDVCDEVWQLLKYTYQRHGVFPTLLERDFNLPPLPELLLELNQLQQLQQQVREGV